MAAAPQALIPLDEAWSRLRQALTEHPHAPATEQRATEDTLGRVLAHIAEGQTPPHGSPDGSPDVDGFATRYRAHVAQEEASVYPHAAELPAPVLRALADAMVARRSPPQD